MPTVLTVGPYRFFFFAKDVGEPPHIHVERDEDTAKFWLSPIRRASNDRFREHELKRIEKIVKENKQLFLERWHEFFKK
jgi:uncharacterized protein DUF4160